MAFFKQMRLYFVLFICFGLWSTWKNFKYKKILRFFAVSSVQQEFMSFLSVIFNYNIFEDYSLSTTIANWLYIVVSLTHFIIALESLYKAESQVKLIEQFGLVDDLFSQKLGILIPYRQERWAMFKRNVVFMVLVILFKVITTTILHFQDEVFDFWYPALYSTWIMRLRIVQIIFFVCLIRNRLRLINDELKAIQRVLDNKFGCTSIQIGNDIFKRLLNLKMVYGELYDTCILMNRTFAWSILSIFIQCFVDFTCNCYWTFIYLVEAKLALENLLICISLLLPIVVLLSPFSFYCSSCFKWVRQFNKENKIIFSLLLL